MATFQVQTKAGAVFNIEGDAIGIEPGGVVSVVDADGKFLVVVAPEQLDHIRRLP